MTVPAFRQEAAQAAIRPPRALALVVQEERRVRATCSKCALCLIFTLRAAPGNARMSRMVHVRVRTHRGAPAEDLDLDGTVPFGVLKHQYAERLQKPVEQLRVLLNGAEPKDGETLLDRRVTPHDEIWVVSYARPAFRRIFRFITDRTRLAGNHVDVHRLSTPVAHRLPLRLPHRLRPRPRSPLPLASRRRLCRARPAHRSQPRRSRCTNRSPAHRRHNSRCPRCPHCLRCRLPPPRPQPRRPQPPPRVPPPLHRFRFRCANKRPRPRP